MTVQCYVGTLGEFSFSSFQKHKVFPFSIEMKFLAILVTWWSLSLSQRIDGPNRLSSQSKISRKLESDITNPVKYNNLTNICTPDICKGKHLDDIPDFDGVISSKFVEDIYAANYSIFDKIAISQCFSNKRIAIFGDSTMTEFVLGMFSILTGIFRQQHKADWQTYMDHTMAKVLPQGYTDHFKFDGIPEFTVVIGRYGHRNFSLHMPSIHSDIFHRFTGAGNDLNSNFGGVKEMMKHMPPDFLCLIGVNCPVPDVIIYQSGHHDVNDWHGTINELPKLFRLLQDAKNRGSRVYWKSSSDNYRESHQDVRTGVMNQAAELFSYEYHINYINMDIARDMFAKHYNSREYIEEGAGPHSGLIGGNAHPDHPMLYIMWKINFILNYICPK